MCKQEKVGGKWNCCVVKGIIYYRDGLRYVKGQVWDSFVHTTLPITGKGPTVVRSASSRYIKVVTHIFDRAKGDTASGAERIYFYRAPKATAVFYAASSNLFADLYILGRSSLTDINPRFISKHAQKSRPRLYQLAHLPPPQRQFTIQMATTLCCCFWKFSNRYLPALAAEAHLVTSFVEVAAVLIS